MKKYNLVQEKHIAELSTEAKVYEHEKSGARVLCLKNQDENKVFSIAFRTPAADSTGVAHITEHSVLCGSEKFPLKDPFVELIKGSLNTFLNAMTYPDKTVYPVASTNDKDFQNLMDVYCDAVFHPNCIKNPHTFSQEGWHYTLDEKGNLGYSGVVYNEMRGAFSEPESVLERYIFHSLFPDTTYGNESGGDPEDIPSLTYEAFQAFHARYYHPSNSYIILYGDMDMEEKLNWLDAQYLAKYERINPDSEIAHQKAFSKMVEETEYYPISKEEKPEGKAYFSYNFVLDAGQDAKKSLAFSYIGHALISGPGAVLKQRLLEEGLGEDIFGGYADGVLQHYFTITAKNAKEEDKARFLKVIQDCIREASEKGLDHKTIRAAIHHDAFQYKEADYGNTPKGLIYSLKALDSWLYDGEPWLYLEQDCYFKELEKELDEGYFEELLKEYFMDVKHVSFVALLPKPGLTEENAEKLAKKLKEKKETLSKEEIEAIKKEEEALLLYQNKENSKEALETLPVLSREDLGKKAESYLREEENLSGKKVMLYPVDSKGVLYLRLLFNTKDFSEEELSYLSVLSTAFAYMDTDKYSFQDLNSEIYLHSGGFSTDITSYPDFQDKNKYTGVFSFGFKFLEGEMKQGLEYLEEICFHTHLQDEKRLSEILLEIKSRERMRLEGTGHSYAVNSAMESFSPTSSYQERVKGIRYYHFIEKLEEEFRKDPKALGERLKALSEKLLRGRNLRIAVGGDLEIYRKEKESLSAFLTKCFPEKEEWKESEFVVSKGERKAWITPSQVNYVARVGSFHDDSLPYTGALKVMKNALSFDFLWKNIREKGNAYGAMSGFGRNGESYVVSFRDPHVGRSYEEYKKIATYLRDFEATELEMTKYIIGAISEMDTPKTAYTKFLLGLSCSLSHLTDEDLQRERDEVLSASPEAIRKLSGYIEKAFSEEILCTIGNGEKIEKNKSYFDVIREI